MYKSELETVSSRIDSVNLQNSLPFDVSQMSSFILDSTFDMTDVGRKTKTKIKYIKKIRTIYSNASKILFFWV